MEYLSDALEFEESGELASAATAYCLEGLRLIEEGQYTTEQSVRRGVTRILEAMSADVRDENTDRARHRFTVFTWGFEKALENADSLVLTGLAHEWLGDAYLLQKNTAAVEYFSLARDAFEELDYDPQMFWGAQPEYDAEYGAMAQYFDYHGIEYYEDHSIDFEGRIQFKLDAIEEHDLLTENT